MAAVRNRRARARQVAQLCLYATIIVAPWHVYRHPLGPVNVSFFRVCLALLALIVCVELLRRPRALLPTARQLRWFLIGTAAFLALGAVERGRSVSHLGTTVLEQQVLFFVAVGIIAGAALLLDTTWPTLRRLMLASAIPPYLLAVEQWRVGASSQLPFQSLIGDRGGLDLLRSGGYSGTGIRPAATFSDPNFLGIFCAITLAVADQHRRETTGLERLLAIVVEVGSLVVLVLSGSRTGLVAVAAFFVVRLFRAARRRTNSRMTIGLTLAGLAVIGTLAAMTLAARGGSSVSSERHIEMELTALGLGLSHPAVGIGLANLGPVLAEPPDRSSANSVPFTVFAEEGLLGVLLCGIALVAPAAKAAGVALNGREAALAVALVVALVFYDYVFVIDVAALWWALLVISVGRGRAPATFPRKRPELASPPRLRHLLARGARS